MCVCVCLRVCVSACVRACVRALLHARIQAFEANPGKGMMVEYPHLPGGIVTTVLPEHFRVDVSDAERDRMMDTTRMYSKVQEQYGSGGMVVVMVVVYLWCI